MKYFVFGIWLSITITGCKGKEIDQNSVNMPVVPTAPPVVAFKPVPININNGSGYSWHKHFDYSKHTGEGTYSNYANLNQADSMVELLSYDPKYFDVIETTQNLTNDADKWLVFQDWVGPENAKLRFAISKNHAWQTGVIDHDGKIKYYPETSFSDVEFNQLLQLNLLNCAPLVVHGYTKSISVGSKEGNEKDFNFYNEPNYKNGKCKAEKKDRDSLNLITGFFSSLGYE